MPVDRDPAPHRPAPAPVGADTARPRDVVLGVGASRGCPPDELRALADAALGEAGVPPASVVAVASADVKADEPAVLALAAGLGVPARFLPAAALAAVEVPTPSAVVASHVGTPSVAEAAALLVAREAGDAAWSGAAPAPGGGASATRQRRPVPSAAAPTPGDGASAARRRRPVPPAAAPAPDDGPPAARLLVPKRRSAHATCAIAVVGTPDSRAGRPSPPAGSPSPVPTEVPLP